MYLDVVFGEVNVEQHVGKVEAMSDIAKRMRDITGFFKTAKLEQSYQRVREEQFRDSSERVNSKIVNWTLTQMFILGNLNLFIHLY